MNKIAKAKSEYIFLKMAWKCEPYEHPEFKGISARV